jgi:CelD/BcsL family acetyltransferase involved in cellulose biosynthesis
MKVTKLGTWAEVLPFKKDWDRLLDGFEQATPFLTFEWTELWWRYFGEGKELCLLVVEDDTGVQAIAPLMRYRDHSFLRLPVQVIQLIGNFHSNRLDVITTVANRRACIKAIYGYLQSESWDTLYCLLIPECSPNVSHLLDCCEDFGYKAVMQRVQQSPYVKVETDWSAYWASRSEGGRRGLKNRIRHLEAMGTLHFETMYLADDVDGLMESIFEVASKGWAYRQGSAICSTPQLKGFYAELARIANRRQWLKCHLLKLDDKPIAFEMCLHYNNTTYGLKSGYCEELSKLSPGRVLWYLALQKDFSTHIAEFDFLGNSEPYKLRWATGMREHLKLFIFNSTLRAKWLHWKPLQMKEMLKNSNAQIVRAFSHRAGDVTANVHG